ncbi:MAG: TonB-dependent receptor [Hyphomonadaceae bacterium]|nr:TonB-dependent receptor [Hyphomonadaceae bacterium]
MSPRRLRQLPACAVATAAACIPATVTAQVTDDEIVVTAQRREQSIQDVPIAVTAVSGDFLEDIGAIDITDVQKITPNATIEVARGSNSTLIAFIRGVGQQDPLWGFEPGVGLYVDDVYIARPQGAVLDIFDVERVEVLRGPQGTLYGRNTIGGAIKYVTKGLNMERPTLRVRVNAGSYEQFDQIVSGSIPLGETFAVGGAVAHYTRDGFGENLETGVDHYDKNILAGRVSAEWHPTDTFNLRISADMTQDDSNAKHGHRLLPSRDGTFQVTNNEYDTRAGIGHDNEVETRGVSATATWDISEKLTLKSVTAYREGETVTPIDFDALPQQDFDVPATYEDSQFSQEFQLIYTGERLSGVAGLYYLDGSASGDFDVILSSLGATIYQAGDQTKENLSAYADFTYNVTDRLGVSLGARYTNDKTVADVTRELWLGLGSGSFDSGNMSSVFVATQTGYEDLERKDDEFTPRITIDYALTPETNAYASFSRGFKAGGFDPRARADLDPTGITQEGFGPEKVDSYEVGFKGRLLDNRLSYSIAGFMADYTDQQITVQEGVDSDGDGTNDTFVSSVFNAGKSEYLGLEFEGAFRLSETFTLAAMAGYIDAEIEEIISGGVNIASNFVTQNTPEVTTRFGFIYDHDLGNNGNIIFTGSASYREEYFLANVPIQGFGPGDNPAFPRGGPALDPDEYTVFDLGANWISESGRWEFGVFGRNLSDERARVAAYNLQLGNDWAYSAFYRAPRTVTATIGFNY